MNASLNVRILMQVYSQKRSEYVSDETFFKYFVIYIFIFRLI